jgi:hypothetical protein
VECTRRALQAEACKGARRGGGAGHTLEVRNRQQLYEVAQGEGDFLPLEDGQSELIAAIRRAG